MRRTDRHSKHPAAAMENRTEEEETVKSFIVCLPACNQTGICVMGEKHWSSVCADTVCVCVCGGGGGLTNRNDG